MRPIKISATVGLTMPHPITTYASVSIDVGAEAELDHTEGMHAALDTLHGWVHSLAQARMDATIAGMLKVAPAAAVRRPPAPETWAIPGMWVTVVTGDWEGFVGTVRTAPEPEFPTGPQLVFLNTPSGASWGWTHLDTLRRATEAEIATAREASPQDRPGVRMARWRFATPWRAGEPEAQAAAKEPKPTPWWWIQHIAAPDGRVGQCSGERIVDHVRLLTVMATDSTEREYPLAQLRPATEAEIAGMLEGAQ